jgi:hypothetical protein
MELTVAGSDCKDGRGDQKHAFATLTHTDQLRAAGPAASMAQGHDRASSPNDFSVESGQMSGPTPQPSTIKTIIETLLKPFTVILNPDSRAKCCKRLMRNDCDPRLPECGYSDEHVLLSDNTSTCTRVRP